MQVVRNRINQNTIELTIKESSAEYEKMRAKVLSELSEHSEIKGFRKGTLVPEETLLSKYGEDFIENQTVDKLINALYPKILKKESIVPTGPGNIKEVKSLKPFEIVMEVEVLPEVEFDVKKVNKIKLKKTPVAVENQEVEDAIAEIEKRFTRFETVEDAIIASGDRATIDTAGFEQQGGKEIPETKVKAFPLVIGSGSFIPGFEEKLIGAKAGGVVEFEITFPKDYHSADFRSRKVFFVTTIFKIEKALRPEWTPDFIEKLRGVETDLNGFKEIIRSEILSEKTYRARAEDEKRLLDELDKITDIQLGQHMIEHEKQRIYKEHKQNLESQGIDIAHYLEHIRKSEEGYLKEAIEPEAIRRLKAELFLEKLKDVIQVEVSDAELSEEIEKVMSQYSSAEVKAKLKEKLVPGDSYYEEIKNRLKYKKIIDRFFE